jgi:hypothetical protein
MEVGNTRFMFRVQFGRSRFERNIGAWQWHYSSAHQVSRHPIVSALGDKSRVDENISMFDHHAISLKDISQLIKARDVRRLENRMSCR